MSEPPRLRSLRPDEVAPVLAAAGRAYEADLAANHRLSPGQAARQAEVTGLQQGEALFAILDSAGQVVGHLGLRTDPGRDCAFLTDFDILLAHQGQGHGTAALAALAQDLRAQGINQLRLRVAADNPRARALYHRLGFFETGTNMALTL